MTKLKESKSSNKVLLIGNRGYVGSYLGPFLTKKNYNVFGIDMLDSLDYCTLTKDDVDQFDSIILLAGHSSVRMCEGDMESSFKNNVVNFMELLSKIEKQKFIYASTSSVYGNVLTPGEIASEKESKYVPSNCYDLSKYIIDSYAQLSGKNYYGLRFGTVNGYAPTLRTDLMINSMINTYFNEGNVKVFYGHIHRAVLGMKDLGRAIEAILRSKKEKPDIYNLSSFNSTSLEIAQEVSEIMECEIVEEILETANESKPYDFQMDSSKFERTFNFEFKDSIKSITKSLKNKYNDCLLVSRHDKVEYPTRILSSVL